MEILSKKLAETVAALLHKDAGRDAAQLLADVMELGQPNISNDPAKYNPLLQGYLHHLLENNCRKEAAQILWTPTQFNPSPASAQEVWNFFDTTSLGLIMGAASMGKSFNMGAALLLEWVRDPQWTSVRLIGPSEDHLEANLFSHIVGLHQKATIPLPGTVGELFIGLDPRNQQASAIKGVVIPIGNNKRSGRIQGVKRVPRVKKHPIFGILSRLFIFLDEIENIPRGIWPDIDNVLSAVDGAGDYNGFKLFGAYNPRDQSHEVGQRAEPMLGWRMFDVDKDFRWKSKRGWDVLRLDGEKSENVIAGKTIYPGLQTKEGLEAIARNAGGRNSPGYMTMGRGAYPTGGTELVIIPEGMWNKWVGEFIWYDSPRPAAGADLALDGGADCVYTLGKFGRATGIKFPASLEHPNGRQVMFKDRTNMVVPRFVCQVDKQFVLPKGETVEMANAIIDVNRKAGVKPEFFCCDKTGHGRGVADTIKHIWSPAIWAVNYSDSSSDSKIMIEDSAPCSEAYERMFSELWFALRAYGEYQYFLVHPSVDLVKLTPQVTGRKFHGSGIKSKVESKKDYMSRGFESPDYADSLTLFIHAVRKGTGVQLSMRGESFESGEEDDGWWEHEYKGGVRIDPSNQSDYLNEGPNQF